MPHGTPRMGRALVGGSVALTLALLLTAPIAAQSPSPSVAPVAPPVSELAVTTTYPSVQADPGGTATFPLFVLSPQPERVDLSIGELPEGFSATLSGGGSVVSSVFTGGETPPELELQVDVPEGAVPDTYRVTLAARSETETAELPLDVIVADAAGGTVTLTTDFPLLQGDSTSTFQFNLRLDNETPREVTFGLSGVGPEGWEVEVTPTGQAQASTAVVDAGDSQNIQVTVTPSRFAEAGDYPILVTAEGGPQPAQAELGVSITGSIAATVTTQDGRLNVSATSGSATPVTLVIQNTGTADITELALSSTPPTGWTVTFDTETVDLIPVGGSVSVVASITPSANSVAGDYVVTINARKDDDINQSVQIRTTVEGSSLWIAVGVGVIALVLVGLFLVFRRYGRR